MDEPLVNATVILRPFDREMDSPFIYSTWRNSAYYAAAKMISGAAEAYFREKTKEIRRILPAATVRIACLEDAPSVIVGYSVSTGTHVNFAYVKVDYRGKGIGALLFPKDAETVTNELTKIGAKIVDKKNLTLKEN